MLRLIRAWLRLSKFDAADLLPGSRSAALKRLLKECKE